jgi:hypothetical protein
LRRVVASCKRARDRRLHLSPNVTRIVDPAQAAPLAALTVG